MEKVSPATWKMLNGRRSSASFSGKMRTCANWPGWMSGAICGARSTRRKYWSVSRSLATMVTVCSSMGNGRAVLFGRGVFADLPVGGEREQRPGVAIHVVFQVKHFRETGAGGLGFRPRAVRILCLHEIFDAALEH